MSQPRRASETKPLIAGSLVDLHLFDRGVSVFPALTKPTSPKRDLFSDQSPEAQEPKANLHDAAWEALKKAWRLDGDLHGEQANRLVLDLFHLTLAIAHAPQYQLDHKDALAHDWIHLPIPQERERFQEIAELGEQLAVLLDPVAGATRVLDTLLGAERRDLAIPSTREKNVLRDSDLEVTISYFGAARGGWEERPPREKEPSHTAWGETTGDLYLNDTAYLANVPERVWRYELGGYPVLKKWLGYRDQKRRPGRPLTHQELDHLRGMIQRIAALLLLHEQLDAAYDSSIENAFTSEQLGV